MDFEQELKQVAALYSSQGYQVVQNPGPKDLPDFAKDFKVEIVGRRGDRGVLVSVKKNRQTMAADKDMPRYAEITTGHPSWRYDFAILEAEEPGAREARGAQDFSGEDVIRTTAEAEELARMGFLRAAIFTAWSALEAAMRMRLRALGETAEWGTMPRELLNELYSSGLLDGDEFSHLERLFQVRNQIVHGFTSPTSEGGMVAFLAGLARRLVEESRPVKQTA
jgi:uncharacterized protein YutE (UPF0331/DUF86 family)